MKDVPADYYVRLARIDSRHWWTQGMIEVEAALVAPLLDGRPGGALLDAGCGTGGFLAWARRRGRFASLTGVDLSGEAIDIARKRLPDVDLRVAPLTVLPFADRTFDIAVLNDVLQHVDESETGASLGELRRVLHRHGALVLRTNGARCPRRDRPDWRLYDAASLRHELEGAGFAVRRLTYANLVFSAFAELRGRSPRPPDSATSGIPALPRPTASALGSLALTVEASFVRHGGRIPWGHTLLALAVPR